MMVEIWQNPRDGPGHGQKYIKSNQQCTLKDQIFNVYNFATSTKMIPSL